jgi:hypothetical protein
VQWSLGLRDIGGGGFGDGQEARVVDGDGGTAGGERGGRAERGRERVVVRDVCSWSLSLRARGGRRLAHEQGCGGEKRARGYRRAGVRDMRVDGKVRVETEAGIF